MTEPKQRVRKTREQIFVDEDVWTLALQRTRHILDTFDQVAVAFSGGKDSTATLQVVRTVIAEDPKRWAHHLPLRTIFFDEEAIPVETHDYMERMAQQPDLAVEWYCLPIECRNACSRSSPYWWPWAPEARDLWCRPLPERAITELEGFQVWPAEQRMGAPELNGLMFDPAKGSSCLMMGIRAQESLTRRRMVTQNRVGENYLIKYKDTTNRGGHLHKAYPIYDWTTEDVWTAPKQFGWDYNRAYDRMEMAGISHSMQRCSPAFGEEPLQKLHTYAACFPEVWEKMVDRVPGVGAAARYALTELYAYGSKPPLPEGSTWPEHVAHFIPQHREKDQPMIAARIKGEIKAHYAHTRAPILPYSPSPETGLSWEFLLMVTMRGDFKGRKQTGGRVMTTDEGMQRMWRRWMVELMELYEAHPPVELKAILGYPGILPGDPLILVPERFRDLASKEPA